MLGYWFYDYDHIIDGNGGIRGLSKLLKLTQTCKQQNEVLNPGILTL